MTDDTRLDTLTFAELFHYERGELDRWERFFAEHPAALDLPFDSAGAPDSRMATVRGVMHHIVAVETRYADRLEGVHVTPYDDVPREPAATLFTAAREANRRLAAWTRGASNEALSLQLEFQTISAGTLRASARKIVAHALLHGVRTWAQIATVLRQHGDPTGWHHDLLMSDALD